MTAQIMWDYANVQDISECLRSNGKNASPPYAVFLAISAYYMRRPAFLR